MAGVLSDDDLEQFIERGHCRVPAAFTRAAADQACDRIWARMAAKRGVRRDEPATWPALCDIEEQVDAPEVAACFTDRLAAAIEQLLGARRWSGRRAWGFWPVNFGWRRDQPYHIADDGWHVDGNWFTHTLDCPRQGLLVIGLFTDVAPRGGGTILAEGSHRRTARVLAAHPDGVDHRRLFELVLAEPIGNFHEVTGAAGDVVLAHPFLFHNRGVKHVGPPRVISNTEAPLREPIQPYRPAADRSPLEESIARALAVAADPLPRDAMRCRF
jgi:hypothetical protein